MTVSRNIDAVKGSLDMDFPVSVTPCADYSATEIKRALQDVLSPIGGLEWVAPGMKIAVKVNLITFIKPEKAATTHPSRVKMLIKSK